MSTLAPPPLLRASLLAATALAAAFALALLAGSSGWGWPSDEILHLIRLPRALAAFGVGAALALAGALIQLITRNPLGEPHVLGATSGASLGALLALVLLPVGTAFAAEGGASLGALAAMLLVFGFAGRALGRKSGNAGEPGSTLVVLVGVMIGSACTAGVSFLLSIANDQQLRGLVFWLLGDLNGASLWWPVWLATAVALLLVLPSAAQLDWLARGDAWAWTLGVPVGRRRSVALIAACLAIGAAVATAGTIGFVGLVAPHIVRLLGLRAARWLIPFSALSGGIFLLLADTVARTLIAPSQLPVGVVSSAVGVPLFLWLLLRSRRDKALAAQPIATIATAQHKVGAVPRPAPQPQPAPQAELLQTSDLTLAVGQRVLAQNINLSLRAGECWVVLGPNGAGKSTLLSVLAGLNPPQSGQIHYVGSALNSITPLHNPLQLAQQRAWCPQFWQDPFPMAAWESVAAAILATRPDQPAASIEASARDALAALDMAHLADHNVQFLSGGERQRIAIATAFAQQAPVLLLDEPSSHLDWPHQSLLLCRIKDWLNHGGAAVIVVHDLNLAWALATHALLLDGQGQVWAGPRDEVMLAARLSSAFRAPMAEQHNPTNGEKIFHADWSKSTPHSRITP